MTDLPPPPTRLDEFVAFWAERTPEAEAAVLDGRRLSYAGLAREIDRLAAALLAAGVRKGDRVATLQTPRPEYLVAFLASASIGAVWVGLNPRYRRGELRHVLQDSAPRVLLTRTQIGDRSYADDLAAVAGQDSGIAHVVAFAGEPEVEAVRTFAAFIAEGARSTEGLGDARAAVGARDPCLIVYTSGSTGAPKGALLDHHALAGFALAQNRLWPVSPLRSLNPFPINHVGCVADVSLPCIAAGGTLVFMEQFDPLASLALMERERITLWGSVPSVFQMQLTAPGFDRFDLSAVQLIVWEGAAASEELVARLLAFGVPLATNYSLTEALGVTALAPTRDPDALAASVGEPFPDAEVRLAATGGGDSGAGEVEVRSPYLLQGYWRRPEATAEAMTPDGFLRTGDLAVRRGDGGLRIVGRLKEMYKSGGYNVYPREVEAVLEVHPAVASAAVVSVPDPLWQEVGVAYVVPRDPLDTATLEAWCRERLANYKVPKRFVIEPELPMLPIGKVDKPVLKRRATATFTGNAAEPS